MTVSPAETGIDRYLALLLNRIHPGQRVYPRTLRYLALRQRWDTADESVGQLLALLQDGAATQDYLCRAACHADRILVTTGGMIFRRRLTPEERGRVVIDVSNIVWSFGATSPEISPLGAIVAELRQRGVTEITGIADANLRHVVTDPQRLEETAGLFTRFEYAPAGTTADEVIIARVAASPAAIISNDRFREWKRVNGWSRKNLWRLLTPVIRHSDGSFDFGAAGEEIGCNPGTGRSEHSDEDDDQDDDD